MVKNNEILNQNESQEKQNKSVNNFDYKGPMQSFIEEKIKGNLGYFKTKSSQISWNEFLEYIKDSKNGYDHNIFSVFKNNRDVYLNHLSYQINSLMLPIYELTSKITKIFLQEYDFNTNEKKSLKDYINQSSQSELSSIYYSQIKRKKFLAKSKILGEKKDEVENKMNQIKKEDEKKIEEIFGINSAFYNKVFEKGPNGEFQIRDGKKDVVDAIFALYNSNSYFTIENLHFILQEIKDDKDDLRSIISFFLPSISIKTAIEYELISENQVDKLLKDKLNEYGVSEKNNKKILKALENEIDRLFIDTESLDFSKFNLEDNSQYLLQSVVDEFNLSKVETNEILGLQDFKNFCKKANLGLNIDNFREGNVFKVISTKCDDGSNGKVQYFFIKNIGEETVELINITKRNGISASINNPQSIVSQNIDKDTVKFQKFFDGLVSLKEFGNEIYFEKPSDLKDSKGEELKKIPEKNEIQSKSDLEKALNEIDPKGENIPLEKMAFKFPKGKNDKDNIFDENFFSVTYNPANNSIKLDNGQVFQEGTNHTLSDFLEAFEVNKCTRFEKIDTPEEFLTKMGETSESFKDIIFKDGKLIPGDVKNIKDYPGINLFIGKDQKKDKTIQIDKIEDGRVSFTMGEYKEGNKDKNEPNIFKGEKKAKNWSYTDFFMLIKNRNLTPKKQKVEENHDEHHGAHLHQHGSLFTSWMSNFWSITEIVKGAEQMIHAVQHNLETGNKVKAAKAALFFGKILPHHLQVELQSEVENSEKETMEKIKKELTGVDSKVMFPMIEHILQNTSAPQYEVEAAMFATLKYGSLYPKDLAKYRGSYVWFEKLGGHKNMIPKLTQEMLKDDPDLVITEEVLINALLAQQAMGLIKPKRRSKIHKEFGATIQEGLNKEAGDGERETGLRMTADGRITYIMGEFKGSTFANGIGGMENVWAKGPDPAWKMNTIPFVIMASGLSLDLHQSLINKLKKFGYTTPYNSLALCSSKSGVELYQKYLDKVIEIYSGGTKSKMYEAFQKAKKGSDSGKISLSMKDFWDKYGEELYPVINMNDGFVISQKDKEGNEILNKYWAKIHGLHNSLDFSPKNDQIDEGFYSAENSPFAQSGALLYKIVPKDRGYLDGTGKMVLLSHMDYIKNVLENNNSMVEEKEKKKIFKESYKKLERHVYNKMVAYRPKDLNIGEKWYGGFEIYMEMKKKGFDIYDVQLKNPDNPNEVQKFDDEYDKFLESEWLKFKNKSHNEDEDEVFGEKVKVEKSVDEILDFRPSANDDIHRQVA